MWIYVDPVFKLEFLGFNDAIAAQAQALLVDDPDDDISIDNSEVPIDTVRKTLKMPTKTTIMITTSYLC